ncbi:Non-receptor tyrosine kinase [Heterostelium album PN500]|uniref:Non-receptor tyrosine kinase n=1 Tax=Heterostelium pallidum (strain ATCC 26659 / Pp 5 / PN500) TaxID=670386 RepID=D3BEL8_HETP5|nr:Non-receptor tyrosine kinase [Heterostelium album PN500]EFA80349.1 Non-receptor tyrosine kinase [Heterostelium album PN500]|eukprot:XP_020432469.1 Non-receptor tyrosine kinase [Heterostelium album PN500]
MDSSSSSFSHSVNYHNENRSHLNQQQPQQLATQYPPSPTSQQTTILSILQEGRMQLDDISSKPETSSDCLLRSLVLCINQLLAYGDQLSNNYTQFLPDNMRLPMITIDLYIARILKYSPCSKEYRLITKRNFIVNSYNIHRILITSILVAAKYLDDIFYNNHFYSQVGGVSVKEINVMELDLLKLLSFDVGANLESYVQYANSIEVYNKKIQSHLHINNPISLPISIPSIATPQEGTLSIHLALKDSVSSQDLTSTTNNNNNNNNNNNSQNKHTNNNNNNNPNAFANHSQSSSSLINGSTSKSELQHNNSNNNLKSDTNTTLFI